MSKSKEKRIKKLKKKRIWPSIVGMAIMAIVFLSIIVVIMVESIFDLFNRKLAEGYNLSLKINEIYQEGIKNSYEDIMQYIGYVENVEQVAIFDSNNDFVWSSHDNYPNLKDIILCELFPVGTEAECYNIIIAEDKNGLIEKDDDQYSLSNDILSKINYRAVINGINYADKDVVTNLRIWYVVDTDNANIFVLYNVNIYDSDIYMFLIICMFDVLLVIVIFIYYIINLLGIIKSQRNMTKLIYMDMVTGGNNWLYFNKKGSKLLKKSRRNRKNYAMVHLRMEKYRSFCTCFGVKEGDELIEKFYNQLKYDVNRYEVIAHHEKADFGLLLTYDNVDDLHAKIDNIIQSLNSVVPTIKLYFSVGVCLIENNETNVETLYNNASLARGMNQDDAGRKVAFYDVEMNKQQQWERKVENDMEKALINKEFQVYLQPKYSTKEEKLAGAEALVRWIHPSEGFIPPGRFIPIFEQNGFILQLDDYMLEEISRQQSVWLSQGMDLVPISVNVSRAHFTREDLAEHICGIVDKYNVPHQFIELELTESAFFDDKEVLLDTVKKLREFGFIVSMDDFGAGYSSLNSLKELSIDVLKIDADFFRGAESVERGMLIVSEVIDLAKKLDMKIVAEGIESKEQVEFLAEQECDLIQGYYFAKPMPINEFEEKYRTAQ